MKRCLAMFFFAVLLPFASWAQVSVALSPVPAQQFLSNTGAPLAAGCIYTYITGTSTPLATYVDGTGTTQSPNPIILDAGGYASGVGGTGGLWLSNSSYRFQIWSFGSGAVGSNCGNGVLQRTVDNVSAYAIINQAQNIFLSCGTSDPAGSAGELGCRSDLGNKGRYYSTLWDSLVTETGTATLLNKIINAPTINNATMTLPNIVTPTVNNVPIVNSPATYVSVNNSATGTVVSRLTKLVGGLAQFAATSDVSGIVGIAMQCNGSCGQPGSTIIQQGGTTSCFFDNATTAGDYVTISSLTGGSCHDFGASFPAGTQLIGQALVTSGSSASPLSLLLYPPGIIEGNLGAQAGCTNFTPVTISNNNTAQSLLSCSIPANALSQGSMLEVDLTGIESTASADTIQLITGIGGGTTCPTQSGTTGAANNQPFNLVAKFSVLTAGAGGTGNWSCEYFSSASGGGVVGPNGIVGAPTIAINTTVSNTLLIQVQMSVANTGNSITGQLLKAVIF